MPRYGEIDVDYAKRMAGFPADRDGPIYMLNLMAYKAAADYGPDGETGVSGREADDRYAPLDVLADIGAEVCLFGDVVASTDGWDRVAVVRYPTRASFIAMQSRPDFQRQHVHKEAGMSRTIVMGTLPTDGLPQDDAPLVLLRVWPRVPPAGIDGVAFAVEGTIVGDGRSWQHVHYSPVTSESLPAVEADAQAVVVRPVRARWS